MKTSQTVDELIKQLKNVKKQVGGNAEVFALVPWPQKGGGTHDEPITRAFCANKHGFIEINDTSR